MPFGRKDRKGSRMVVSKLSKGKVTTTLKRNPIDAKQQLTSKGHVDGRSEVGTSNDFDMDQHDACNFLITGEAVEKKGRYEKAKV